MDFGAALRLVKHGTRMCRQGWGTEGGAGRQFIFLVQGSTFHVNRPPLLGIYPEGTLINYHGHIDVRLEGGYIMPWVASHADLLAEDWAVYVDPAADAASPNPAEAQA